MASSIFLFIFLFLDIWFFQVIYTSCSIFALHLWSPLSLCSFLSYLVYSPGWLPHLCNGQNTNLGKVHCMYWRQLEYGTPALSLGQGHLWSYNQKGLIVCHMVHLLLTIVIACCSDIKETKELVLIKGASPLYFCLILVMVNFEVVNTTTFPGRLWMQKISSFLCLLVCFQVPKYC